jgi:membrane associated rhomboid family serine protease
MGIYDREYYRDDAPAGFELRGGWSMTTWLVVANAAVFLANTIVGRDNWLMLQLSATADSLTRPYLWWQLVSYGFVHDPAAIGHIFWNMFGLWVFGRPVEGVYGPKEFLRFYLMGVFLGGLFWTARVWAGSVTGGPPEILLGASGAVTAVTLLFCIHYPKQTILLMMVLPVPAWFVGATIIAGNIYGSLLGSDGVAFDVHLVGAAFAICYYKFGWNLGRWQPALRLPRWTFQRRPRLRVHRPTDHDHAYGDDLARQADELLDKINLYGIDSLTDSERQVLEKHSRRVRERRG